VSQERFQEPDAAVELSGADLARAFHEDLVAPLLTRALPRLRYAAGRLGSGSDVLGLDDAMSRDHDWGCRLTLLVDAADRSAVQQVDEVLDRDLPPTYRGLPLRFSTTWDATESRRVEVSTVGDFAANRLGMDPLPGLSALDWLTLTGQAVLEVTAGPVFTDQTSELTRVRQVLRWYPPDVERYVLAGSRAARSSWSPTTTRSVWNTRSRCTGACPTPNWPSFREPLTACWSRSRICATSSSPNSSPKTPYRRSRRSAGRRT
jgi:hypothetical protein